MSAQSKAKAAVPWINGQEYYFTRENVARSPDHEGVYALMRDETVIYIGSGNIRHRLWAHLKGDHPWITREAPTTYFRETCANHLARVEELRQAFPPLCSAPAVRPLDRKSTRLNSSHIQKSRMPSSA